MDAELRKVLAELESRFDSELARQVEEGANDLAAGLHQDLLARPALARGGAASLLDGGGRRELSVVGRDYVGCGWPLASITKIERAVVGLNDAGSPPTTREDTFVEVVRRWQRAGMRVEVVMEQDSTSGLLDRVAADHLLVRGCGGPVLVPLPTVLCVRLVRGG